MDKIKDFIRKTGTKPSDCIYHTWRDAKNSKKQLTGKIRLLVLKSDSIARCEYVCPECKFEGYVEKEWKRPFSIKCEKCEFRITVPRMRDEAKREAKNKS